MNTLSKKEARDEQRHKPKPIVRWIDVNDALPEDPDELVLTCSKHYPVHAGYYGFGGWSTAAMIRDPTDVTHWAKLPKGAHE